ncbi:activator-dependent family glycosyltransferase [Prauserella cavernicola]|uniref:Activator-dependent family glycosyltransferase n=1 Tax=Prauserella cavernicola TaxID=2800127 RepID=A0A934QYY1_9PSEU|nr:activator-dependent family glycosyltransferase [Prauserella cavernicola]MBK1787859.1 activator-dependent family glycosyltransferase [Prauserella cavernicola]
MRVLFVSYPEKTVFQYLVPLAWALRTAGHEVAFAGQGNFTDVITQAGLTAVPVSDNAEPWRVTNLTADQLESERAGLPAPYDVADDPGKATWEYLRDGYADRVVGRYVMESIPMIPGLVSYARYWRPDLVVWESNCAAGPIAAKACGAANVRVLFGQDIFGVTRAHYLRLRERQPDGDRADPFADWLGENARAYGAEFSEDMVTGQATIDQFPTSLQARADGLRYLATQYVPYGGPAVVPRWLWEPPKRPRVGLTMGLSATEHFNGYTVDMATLLTNLSELDVEVVATVADSVRERLGPLPDNVRTVSYVPLHALAPTCSAFVHHAGAATLATVSRYGVPQLAVHLHFDQPMYARRLAEHGAGIAIPNDEATGRSVRDGVRRLLTEPTFRERANELRDEIRAAPAPNEIVRQLEELATGHRSPVPG